MRILAVDDDPIVLKLIAHALSRAGHEVLAAHGMARKPWRGRRTSSPMSSSRT